LPTLKNCQQIRNGDGLLACPFGRLITPPIPVANIIIYFLLLHHLIAHVGEKDTGAGFPPLAFIYQFQYLTNLSLSRVPAF
jgi:hypothetical protein